MITMTAELSEINGTRRRSYDDQEGDNDITIVLQPSDLHDIEKRSINNKSRNTALSFGKVDSSKFKTSTTNKQLSRNDLKMAKCLLDQDYNLTVRLFINKSALNWNFNSFTFDAMCCGRSLTELLLHLFDYYNLYDIFNLDMVNVLKCFRLLEFGYHSTNPYHNSIHAADVTQAMHCFIQENKIKKHMTHLETLCSILAAVCHDLDHPGVNQSFLVATNNPLASLYNNNSVLENHHWRFALCIFKESKLFDHFEEEVLEEMKKQLKHLILATDIARQNEYLKRFKDLTSSHKFSMRNTDDRALVLQMALKCADLGNPCRPWLISRVWSNLICDEFYKMGRIERRLGIPLTPICQREKTSIAGIQTDFFRFIVMPLLELWHKFLKSPLSDLLMSNFDHNYQRWQRANRIVQQLKRRKSMACLEPVEDVSADETGENSTLNQNITLGSCSKHSYAAIKRASSDYIKSGNARLELLRNFQLDRIIKKSPLVTTDSNFHKNLATEECTTQKKSISARSRAHKRSAKEKDSDSINIEQQQKSLRCVQTINPSRNLIMCNYRKALSPIEDGDAPSPDQQQYLDREILCSIEKKSNSAFPSSPQSDNSSTSSFVSQASSACSSPVIHRSTSRASIDRISGNNATLQVHQHIKQQQTHLKHHPFLAQYYESSGGGINRPTNPNAVARHSTSSSMPVSF